DHPVHLDKPAVHVSSHRSSSYHLTFHLHKHHSNEHYIKVSKIVIDVVYSLRADHEKIKSFFAGLKDSRKKIKFNGRGNAGLSSIGYMLHSVIRRGISLESVEHNSQPGTYIQAREERNSQLIVYGMMASMYDKSDSGDDVSAKDGVPAEDCVPTEVVISAESVDSADCVVVSAEVSVSADCSVPAGGAQIVFWTLRNQFDATVISLNSYKEAVKTFERQIKHYQNNQLAYEEKIRVLSYDLADKSNILEYKKKLINQASQENNSMTARTKQGLGFHNWIGDDDWGFGNSEFSVFTPDLDDIGAKPIYNRFDKVDHMKAVPPPMTGNYKPTSNASDDNEIVREYGKQTSETTEIKNFLRGVRNSNDSAFFDFSDRSSEPSPKDFSSFDSSMECSEPSTSDNDSQDSTSVKSTGSASEETRVTGSILGPTPFLLLPLISAEFPLLLISRATKMDSHNTYDKAKDRACSHTVVLKHVWNRDKLEDFVAIDGGEVTFGGGVGHITGKVTIRTKTMDFENVLYVKELDQFNLISVSLICDKKHRVLFTENECIVLSSSSSYLISWFYSLFQGDSTCLSFCLIDFYSQGHHHWLLAKASVDESNKWHRRLGHVNFKNMNKLMSIPGFFGYFFMEHKSEDIPSSSKILSNLVEKSVQPQGNVSSPVQTRSQLKEKKQSASAFMEPASVDQALNNPDWVEAMQEEMQQFKNQQVWVLVELPKGKRAIGTKWILKNKRDARGIVCRNKARLVAQGHRQEEGIDYTLTVFATRLLELRANQIYLAFSLIYGTFMVYQMDVKSAFLNGKIEEELWRAWYATLSSFLLRMDIDGEHDPDSLYKENANDIILVQVSPTTSNLLAVKRIFKYLKAFPKLGLWYPRDSPFHLEAFSDSDYAGATGDRNLLRWNVNILRESGYLLGHVKSKLSWLHLLVKQKYVEMIMLWLSIPTVLFLVSADLFADGIVGSSNFWQPPQSFPSDGMWHCCPTMMPMHLPSLRLLYDVLCAKMPRCKPLSTSMMIYNSGIADTLGYVPDQGGTVMPLLPTMLTIVDESVGQSSQEVPQMHPDPNPSTIDLPVSELPHATHLLLLHLLVPRWTRDRVQLLQLLLKATGGAPIFESPLGLTHVPQSLHLSVLTEKVSSLENALTDMKQTHGKVVIRLINKVKRLENKLKQRKRNVIVSDEDDEMVEPDADWDVFLDLARRSPTSGHVTPSMATTSKPLSEEEIEAALTLSAARAKQRSFHTMYTISGWLKLFVSAAVGIPAESSGLATSIPSPLFTTSTVVSTATVAHPSTSFAPSTVEKASSPLRDPTKGKGVAETTSHVPSSHERVRDQHAAII
ncbi:putative ribonuclease H-like domain-containing protein, partial [Tanacetum coccineum]